MHNISACTQNTSVRLNRQLKADSGKVKRQSNVNNSNRHEALQIRSYIYKIPQALRFCQINTRNRYERQNGNFPRRESIAGFFRCGFFALLLLNIIHEKRRGDFYRALIYLRAYITRFKIEPKTPDYINIIITVPIPTTAKDAAADDIPINISVL